MEYDELRADAAFVTAIADGVAEAVRAGAVGERAAREGVAREGAMREGVAREGTMREEATR